MKRTIVTISGFVFAFFLVGGANAEAACPYPAYYNSQNLCVRDVYTYTLPQPTPYTSYHYQPQHNAGQIAALQAYVAQLQQLLLLLQAQTGTTPTTPTNSGGTSRVDVETESAEDVTDERATLVGEVDFNREDEAVVYFEWGRSRNDLDEETIEIVLDEDDDDEEFSIRLNDLREDTRYYFRAVAEDERGRKTFGDIEDFRTDDDNRNDDEDYPDVDLDEADDITDDSAEFEGDIDMNDFRNGRAFVVYGEDEDQVDDIARDYDSYRDIDEDGDDLQKFVIDTDVDDDVNVSFELDGLDDETDYYVALCVEFEDEDDDDRIICSNTEEFETDD